jgi:hypothetical protein
MYLKGLPGDQNQQHKKWKSATTPELMAGSSPTSNMDAWHTQVFEILKVTEVKSSKRHHLVGIFHYYLT